MVPLCLLEFGVQLFGHLDVARLRIDFAQLLDDYPLLAR
jgi:hypothetical protein